MSYEVFFSGVGGTILGTLIGAWISCRLTYAFQKKLLDQQLDFQKKQADADALLREKIHAESLQTLQKIQSAINTHGKRIIGQVI